MNAVSKRFSIIFSLRTESFHVWISINKKYGSPDQCPHSSFFPHLVFLIISAAGSCGFLVLFFFLIRCKIWSEEETEQSGTGKCVWTAQLRASLCKLASSWAVTLPACFGSAPAVSEVSANSSKEIHFRIISFLRCLYLFFYAKTRNFICFTEQKPLQSKRVESHVPPHVKVFSTNRQLRHRNNGCLHNSCVTIQCSKFTL